MKKAVRISVYSLVLLAVIFFSLPYAITLESVQSVLGNRLYARLGIRADVDRIAWEWFPTPRVSLFQARLSHKSADVSFPYGEVYPDIVGLMRRRPGVKLMLDRPEMVVKSLSRYGIQEEQPALPSVSLNIKNGRLLLPSDGFLEKLADQTPHTEISEIDADVALSHNGFDIKSAGRLSFAEKVISHVRVNKQRQEKTGNLKNYWRLDISGENLDLTGAREKVLLLFGDNGTAQQVCDIVRGGRAKTGRYRFEGYAGDFANLKAMKISASAENVDIHVPEVGLPLENCAGPIVIENAILTGQSLSARLGNSTGQNGAIRIDLLGRDSVFQLSVDVDADVKELRGWLINNLLTRHPAVVNELLKINSAQGRARGRLHIGDSFDHLVVTADVSESDSLIEYRRFGHPVQFKHGVLTVYPDRLTWDGVSGRIGPQHIDDSAGAISWQDDILLDVSKIDARLEAGPLLKEITALPAVKDDLAPLIHSADGPFEIKNMKISGPVNDFKKLACDFTVTTDGLTIQSPLLPKEVRIQTAGARISDSRIVLPPSRIDVSGRRLTLETDLAHTFWKDFSGSLKITGTIGKQIAQWVKKKAWIPPAFFPGVPCFLDPLTVSFTGNEFNLKGKIISGGNPNRITSQLDLTLSENRVDLKKLAVSAPDETADIRLRLDRGQHSLLKAGFAGSLKKETLDIVLENNRFLTGRITGACELEYDYNNAAAHRMKGSLEASGGFLYIKDNRITINNVAITGHNSHVEINRADLRLNDESVIVDGRLYFPDEADIKTDLNVKSGYVSARNLQRLFRDLFSPSAKNGFSATGNINVDIEKFQYNPDQAVSSSKVKQFTGHDLSGTVTLQPGNRISISILSGNVCGATVAGIVGLPPETTALDFHSRAGAKPDVQELIDCLGINDKEISGDYVLDAAIKGAPGNWTGGHIEFRAENGRLKGLIILSKILTLLNVTELFSFNVVRNFFTYGYPYSEMKVSGKIADNILTVNETKIIGEGLDIFIKGTVNLKTADLDLVAYVTPLKTIDFIVTLIPYVGKTLGKGEKSVAFVPFKIKGTIENPDVFLIFEDQTKEKTQ